MANWFKLYETDLDETRLKYALNKLPEVGWVWIGILSECCKQSSDTIRWSNKEHELFGFSERLKVSIGKVNEAINLLVEIEYLKRGENTITAVSWNSNQSEYNLRKKRGDYEKKKKNRRVSDNIGESPVEERRGEENRGDKKQRVAPLPCSPLIKEVFDEWNKQDSLPHCLLVSDSRRRSLESRGREDFFKTNWRAALKKATESEFCRGNNERGWKATFDWFITPEVVPKLMEGKYDNRPNGNHQIRKPNPRNAGIIVGPTNYATAKPRLQRELEEKAILARPVAIPDENSPQTNGNGELHL